MHPYFYVFNRQISGYAAMGVIGFICTLIYVFLKCKKQKESFDNAVYILVFAFIGALIGAKILYLFIERSTLIHDVLNAKKNWVYVIYKYLSGGMVFYGGLLSGIAGAFLTAKFYKVKIENMYSIFVPAIPLFAGFGRLGCLMMGCCYGKQTNSPFCIIFTESPFAPNHVNLVPTQLYEAIFDFALFTTLAFLGENERIESKLLEFYLFAYAFFRFCIEFLRDDDIRGIFLLSTSQWISLVILLFVVVIGAKKKRKIA